MSEHLLNNHLVFHISPGTSQNLLTLHSLHQIHSNNFNKCFLDINKYLCASTLPSLVSETLCEDFGIKELITISLDFFLDGLDVYNLVENSEPWNKSEFILGENFTSRVSINHQENEK